MDEIINNQQQSDCSDKLVLRTEGLVKRYGKRTVANGVTINVKQGEIVGLLGPNGAGKTTSFYMTTGLVVPNEGHVYLGDQDITNYPVYKRARAGIGYLPQEASVFRKMSVEDNIKNVFLNPASAIFEEPENLLKQEVREPAVYNAIITAVATAIISQVHIVEFIPKKLAVFASVAVLVAL